MSCEGAINNEVSLFESLSIDMVATWKSIGAELRELLNGTYQPEFKPPNNWEKEVEDITRIDDYLWAHLMARDIRTKGADPDEAQRADRIAAGLLSEESQVTRNQGIEAVISIWHNVNVDKGDHLTSQDDDLPVGAPSTDPLKKPETETPDEPFSKPTSPVPSPDTATTRPLEPTSSVGELTFLIQHSAVDGKTYIYARTLMQAGHFEFQTTDVADGPRNAEIWTSSVMFNNIDPVYRQCVGQTFVGTGRTKAEARDMAAYTALCAIGAIARS